MPGLMDRVIYLDKDGAEQQGTILDTGFGKHSRDSRVNEVLFAISNDKTHVITTHTHMQILRVVAEGRPPLKTEVGDHVIYKDLNGFSREGVVSSHRAAERLPIIRADLVEYRDEQTILCEPPMTVIENEAQARIDIVPNDHILEVISTGPALTAEATSALRTIPDDALWDILAVMMKDAHRAYLADRLDPGKQSDLQITTEACIQFWGLSEDEKAKLCSVPLNRMSLRVTQWAKVRAMRAKPAPDADAPA